MNSSYVMHMIEEKEVLSDCIYYLTVDGSVAFCNNLFTQSSKDEEETDTVLGVNN